MEERKYIFVFLSSSRWSLHVLAEGECMEEYYQGGKGKYELQYLLLQTSCMHAKEAYLI